MKRVIRSLSDPEELSFKIDVYHKLVDSDPTVAASTEIKDILNEMGDIDPQALADYQSFQSNFDAMMDYYGFSILRAKESKSKPHTSKYEWIAYASQANAGDIPLLIRLRLSDHEQKFGPEYTKELAQRERQEAADLKMPKSKRKQKFIVTDVVVNNKKYSSYEEALNAMDKIIHSWLERLNIDLTDIEPFGVW